MENNAVCRGNQHCLYYGLKLSKHNTPRGLHTPARARRARIYRNEHSEARKNLTKIGAGNLGRNQSRLRLPGRPTGPLITK